jgi:hypothetical protein
MPSSAGFTASTEEDLSSQVSLVVPDFSLKAEDIRQWVHAASSAPLHQADPPSPCGTTNTEWSQRTAGASAVFGDWMSLKKQEAIFHLAEYE